MELDFAHAILQCYGVGRESDSAINVDITHTFPPNEFPGQIKSGTKAGYKVSYSGIFSWLSEKES
jgi:hypothetical protein